MSVISGTRQECEQKTADAIFGEITKLLEKQDYVVFGLVGGRSVSGIYKLLAAKNLDWEKIHFFMIDERQVPQDDKESNYKLAKSIFTTQQLYPYDYKQGPDFYSQKLGQFGGMFDIILVSAGEDGHIGALFPKHHSILNKSELFISMDDSPKEPARRMSASFTLLSRSKIGFVLFFGDGKKQALENFLDKDTTIEESPATLIKNIKQHYVVSDFL